ncbi:FTR1 family iron permease [Duganella sp. LjRoot269]|uniref:FTR1 family iron permease n=1 Tax=Duganella sp. LjRoot269 TaxID=3342305 RepID=UPI003ED13D39
MLSTLIITFREGVEAFLVVAVTLLYLKQTGRQHLITSMKLGVVVAIVGSVILGIVLAELGALTPASEGWLALMAFSLVSSCTVHMVRNGKRISTEIRLGLAAADERGGMAAKLGVFLFVLLMIGREGVETATMLATIASSADFRSLLTGGLVGTFLAALLSLAWTRFGKRINLGKFFQATAVFMVLFSIQLVIYAFHEFTEGAVIPGIDNAHWHVVTEPYGPDGMYGAWLSYSLVLIPLLFLGVSFVNVPKLVARFSGALRSS